MTAVDTAQLWQRQEERWTVCKCVKLENESGITLHHVMCPSGYRYSEYTVHRGQPISIAISLDGSNGHLQFFRIPAVACSHSCCVVTRGVL